MCWVACTLAHLSVCLCRVPACVCVHVIFVEYRNTVATAGEQRAKYILYKYIATMSACIGM